MEASKQARLLRTRAMAIHVENLTEVKNGALVGSTHGERVAASSIAGECAKVDIHNG